MGRFVDCEWQGVKPFYLMVELGTGSQRLAQFLLERRDLILEKWVKVLQNDSRFAFPYWLDPKEILNHVDELLMYLIELLQNDSIPEVEELAKATAAAHGRSRWRGGFRPDELILELSHLRSIIIPHFFEFLERNPDIGGAACITLSVALHRLLDDTMRRSVLEYLRAQQRIF